MVLQGDVEIAIPKTTGRSYLTARKTSTPYTFYEKFGQQLVGQQLPGIIERKECKPYEFLVPGAKKPITLTHT
jgi:hypothetical protein